MLVDFGKVPNIPVPDHLAVDRNERIYVLSPALPNFKKLKETARQGEAVYPSTLQDDNDFSQRFGDATIDTLGQEGTDNKVLLALGREDGLIRSTLSLAFMGVSRFSSRVYFRDVPSDPEVIRRATPQQIRNARILDIAFAYAVNNFYETRPGQKNEDAKEFGAGAGRREILTTAQYASPRLAVVTGTPTKQYEPGHSRKPSESDLEHALRYVFFLAETQRSWKQTRSQEAQKRLEWGQVAHQAANGAALGDIKTVDGRVILTFSYAAGVDYKDDYDNGSLVMGKHLLANVPGQYREQVRAIPSFVRIKRPSACDQVNHAGAHHNLRHLRQHHA